MLAKILSALVILTLSAGSALAGTCTPTTRNSVSNIDVNIKVKNDTTDPIIVSIWKGTLTERKTIFSEDVEVPSDGKEGKTDKNVTNADFYFAARKEDSEVEAHCHFFVDEGQRETSIGSFSCSDEGVFEISCEKSYNPDKSRWNVQFSLE